LVVRANHLSTLAPIDRRLISTDVLTAPETRWLDRYHARVLESLAPLLDPPTQASLKTATARIGTG
jgi:Xaa-Pro aminopeptidase